MHTTRVPRIGSKCFMNPPLDFLNFEFVYFLGFNRGFGSIETAPFLNIHVEKNHTETFVQTVMFLFVLAFRL